MLAWLAPVPVAWWIFGWHAASVAVASIVVGFVVGYIRMWADLTAAGYVVEHRPDARGRARWRVGVRRPVAPVAAPPVEWLSPPGAP